MPQRRDLTGSLPTAGEHLGRHEQDATGGCAENTALGAAVSSETEAGQRADATCECQPTGAWVSSRHWTGRAAHLLHAMTLIGSPPTAWRRVEA